MADRGRSYRLHQEALARIKNRPSSYKNSGARSNMGAIPSYAGSSANDDGNSNYARSISLLSKAQKEKQIQIYNENQKILRAIEYQSPTICRADFYEHELDHQRQVSRMTGKQEIYGFPSAKDANRGNINKKNKSKKNKNFDPEIVRPIPKKFDIASFENAESNSKSSSSNKKPQKENNKNGNSNEGKLDDILSNNANGLCDASKNSSNNSQSKNKPKKKAQETTSKDKSGGELGEIIASGVDGLNSTPKVDDKDNKEDDENDEKDKNDENEDKDKDDSEDGSLDQIVGNGVNSLTGDDKK